MVVIVRRRHLHVFAATMLVAGLMAGSVAGATQRDEDFDSTSDEITARIMLPSRIRSGSRVNAIVVVDNATGRDVVGEGCIAIFAVALSNSAVHPDPDWLLCRGSRVIPEGTSQWPVVVSARYPTCDSGPPPSCLDRDALPLPPGRYRAKLYQPSPNVASARAVPVHVTP